MSVQDSGRPDPSPESRGGKVARRLLEAKLRFGFVVFGVLVALEVAEYVLGVTMKTGAWPFLAILATIAAWPIVHYFMHIMQLKRPKE